MNLASPITCFEYIIRRSLLLAALVLWLPVVSLSASADHPPNIILVLADDLGYGDIGAFGSRAIRTPSIDRLASEGIVLTQFYTSGNVCTPSRAGILTGRYPIRTGLADRTVHPGDSRGIKREEVTLPERLGELGYTNALIGKWHLGDQPEHHPLEHGFDHFFGTMYSNDEAEQSLLRGHEVVEQRINAQSLALGFIDESLEFISATQQPYFLMLTTTSPHKPLRPSSRFAGKSEAGAYGDVVEELDWGVGEIMRLLSDLDQALNTIVIFTSDNGPFPQGSAGGYQGGKGTGWEGGYRVPFIARWPQGIEPNTASSAMAMNIDIMPTLVNLAGGSVDQTRNVVDGKNIASVLQGSNVSPHEVLYFFNNERISALRTDRWRLMASDYPPWRDAQPLRFENKPFLHTLLYDMNVSPAQQYDLSERYPDQKQLMQQYLESGRTNLEFLSDKPDSTQYGDSID
jgi:arylsulfatase A